MLTIRKAQVAEFERQAAASFRNRLRQQLDGNGQLASGANGGIDEAIERGLALSQLCNLRREKDIARLTALMVGHPGSSPKQPLPRRLLAVLTSYGSDPQRKLDWLETWIKQNRRDSR